MMKKTKGLKSFYLRQIIICLLEMALVLAIFPTVVSATQLEQEDTLQLQADALHKEALDLFYQENYQAALPKFEIALSIYKEIGNRRWQAIELNDIGLIYNFLGRYDQALDYYQQSLKIIEDSTDLRDISNRGGTLGNMGEVYRDLGQYELAINYLQRALAIHRQIGDRGPEGITLAGIGRVYQVLGRNEEAFNYYQQALAIFQAGTGDPRGEANTLKIIGAYYVELGQYEQALSYYQKALALHRGMGNRAMEGLIFSKIGESYSKQANYEMALANYQQALIIHQEVGNQLMEGETLTNIGRVHFALGEFHQALDYYQQALDIHRRVNNELMEATTLNSIGKVYQALGQNEEAFESYQLALSIFHEIGMLREEWVVLTNIGIFHEILGNTEQAIVFLKQAIDVIESIQGEIKVDEFKVSFATGHIAVYERLINLLWQAGHFEESFSYVERSRSRAFLDQQANGRIDYRAGANVALLEQEQTLRYEVAARRAQLITLRSHLSGDWNQEAINSVEMELTMLEEEYAKLMRELKIQSPEVASLISVEIASLTEVQSWLDNNTALIEYFMTEERTLVFIISRGKLESISINVSRQKLSETIAIFRDFASLDDPHPYELQHLYHWLIEPLKPYIDVPIIGIIPHNVLHYLPFTALSDGEHYLSDDYTLFTLPSASVLRFIREKRKPNPNTILALGNPTVDEPGLTNLKSAEQEVNMIASLYGIRALVGNAATESAVWSQANKVGILHLAAHGTFNPYNPLFSAIHLAKDKDNDGLLEVHEIYGLDLIHADLVVLSACKTVIGELSAGDEVVGLNRAFLYTGTPTVIASLWNVEDKATGILMERFYTHLRTGLNKAKALRQAQQEIREEYPHPYYWAAFVLTGDPGE
ncbi:MAG: CHAT domain-containing protein [Anaerolineae bacterium]|nr:CHAT domain-containing protein [Anaerolineae bacterium]